MESSETKNAPAILGPEGTPYNPRKSPAILRGEHAVSRAHGHMFTTDWDGKQETKDTLQCCHCGYHWIVEPGSGKKRGFCTKCMGPTCGRSKRCMTVCTPYKKLFNE